MNPNRVSEMGLELMTGLHWNRVSVTRLELMTDFVGLKLKTGFCRKPHIRGYSYKGGSSTIGLTGVFPLHQMHQNIF